MSQTAGRSGGAEALSWSLRQVFPFVVYGISIALTAALWSRPVLLTGCFAVIAAVVLWRWHGKRDLVYFAVPLVLGPAGEAVAIYFGAWEYSKPLYLIPLWLPLAWGVVVISTLRLSHELVGDDRGAETPPDPSAAPVPGGPLAAVPVASAALPEPSLMLEEYRVLDEQSRFVMTRYMQGLIAYVAVMGYGIKEIFTVASMPVTFVLAGLVFFINFLALYGAGWFRSMAYHALDRQALLADALGFQRPHPMIWGYYVGVFSFLAGQFVILSLVAVRLVAA